MTTCTVLGGAGFIGSHLVDALLGAGHQVRVFDRPHVDRLPQVAAHAGIETFTGDFLNSRSLVPALSGAQVVFHLISTTLPKSSNDNPAYDVESNVIGTVRLLGLCREQGVAKIVFMSSGGTVYGVPRGLPIDEEHPTFPISSYGIQKLTIEKYLHLAERIHGLDYCILRGANVYGPRQRLDIAQGVVAVFLDRALKGKPIEIWGDGSVVRDYLYVEDLARALVKAATYEGEPRIFNVGSGIGTSLNELLSTMRTVTRAKLDVHYSAGRSVDVPANVLGCSRARRHLGWQPEVPLAEGIRRTYEWLRAGA